MDVYDSTQRWCLCNVVCEIVQAVDLCSLQLSFLIPSDKLEQTQEPIHRTW